MSEKGEKHSDAVLAILSKGFPRGFWKNAFAGLDLTPGENILDLGAGRGTRTAVMASRVGPQGKVTGIEISPAFRGDFLKLAGRFPNMSLKMARIDGQFSFPEPFDRVTLFFSLHRFEQHQRILILQNAYECLRPNGRLSILDWNEMRFSAAPRILRSVLKRFECPQAIDFMEREWKEVLGAYRFRDFREIFFFNGRVRLLQAART
ncbi:MAG: class I SAM-dependent methyltransferase [Acidobacteria bacterium]|nr:class I SAM-dependent methyltransferase [Acidobacteriota bacterium]